MKNYNLIASLIFLGFSSFAAAQNFSTRTAEAKFYSHAPLEDIEALNKEVGVLVSIPTNSVKIVVKIVGFTFAKSLMQEHFNENYLESPKFPIASFTGGFTNKENLDIKTPGTYPMVVSGDLSIHGVTIQREIPCTILVGEEGKLTVNSEFMVKLEDHKIKIPSAVGKNIAEEVKVTFSGILAKQP